MRTFIIFAVAAMLLSPLCRPVAAAETVAADRGFEDRTSERIAVLLEKRQGEAMPMLGISRLLVHEQLYDLYRQRQFRPVWMDGWQLKAEAGTLLESLRGAGDHGLCSTDYLLLELEGLFRIQQDFARHGLPLAPDNRAVLDLFLSQAFLTLATHFVEGQVDPSFAHVDWKARRRKADLIKLLEYAIDNRRLAQVLEDLMPPHEEYRRLMSLLGEYRELAARGGWPSIPSGPTLRPEDEDARVPGLRQLLRLTGDLTAEVPDSNKYDSDTVQAVRRFQSRHGLVTDGVIGSRTLEDLNVPVEGRVRQIELNLERWRWMPKSFGDRHLRINIAGFSLEVIEDGRPVMQMPVIVGTQYRKTPVFSAPMTYLEFAPHWTVPPTILREDKLPKIRRDPSYLEKQHFRIISREGGEWVATDPATIDWSRVTARNFPGLLRMDPGPWNPLGRVKFMFPNVFNVYLHDTNEASLFNQNIRYFSSGCIRVKRPLDLAQYLLENSVSCDRILDLMERGSPEKVTIRPVPVHIQYWTAWVGRDGRPQFREDVYLRDLDLEVALESPDYRVLDQLKVSYGTNRLTAL